MLENLRNQFEKKYNIGRTQSNLIFLFMGFWLLQGIFFYYCYPEKFNLTYFILLLIFGFLFNIFYVKLYLG